MIELLNHFYELYDRKEMYEFRRLAFYAEDYLGHNVFHEIFMQDSDKFDSFLQIVLTNKMKCLTCPDNNNKSQE